MRPWQSQSTDTARVGNAAHCGVFYEADDECVSGSVLYGLCLKASVELPVVQGRWLMKRRSQRNAPAAGTGGVIS